LTADRTSYFADRTLARVWRLVRQRLARLGAVRRERGRSRLRPWWGPTAACQPLPLPQGRRWRAAAGAVGRWLRPILDQAPEAGRGWPWPSGWGASWRTRATGA